VVIKLVGRHSRRELHEREASVVQLNGPSGRKARVHDGTLYERVKARQEARFVVVFADGILASCSVLLRYGSQVNPWESVCAVLSEEAGAIEVLEHRTPSGQAEVFQTR
jgi:hypothetical protein